MSDRVDADRAYAHRGGEEPLIGVPVDTFLRDVARRHPECEAVVSIPQRQRLTYAQLMQRVDELARGLLALEVQRGDRVGIWSTDNLEWILLQLATARVGAILVNLNPAYKAAELAHALKLARVQTLFLIPSFRKSDYVGMLESVCPEVGVSAPGPISSPLLPELARAVLYDPDEPGGTERLRPGLSTWPEVIEAGRDIAPSDSASRAASVEFDDPVNIQFTSGTTGFPKAVVLTHHNILNNAWFIGQAMRFTEKDRLCVPVPFYHCFGMVVSTLTSLTRGATVVIPSAHFEAGAALAAIEAERCTALHGVPTMFIAELERPEFDQYDLGSLRTGIMAGAPCPPQIMRRVIDDMGCREILIGYGLTESSPVSHLTRPDDSLEQRTETVGFNLPHQEVKVIDTETGAVVSRGETGEICLRGYHIMRGYYDQPDETAQTIDPAGWLHSGDLGVMESDGVVRITGRLKDMIIRGGENIYPAEIETAYYDHPQVAEVAVFGVPDERMGEEVAAWIMLHEGQSADPEELKEWGKQRMAHFKVPRLIWVVDEFPETVTGKIQKYRMREIAARWREESAV